ncbi:MAG: peptide deformylase [Candidatus Eiseniibacteriota bacterium]
MAVLEIARMGHPVLIRTAAPVMPAELSGGRVQQLIDDMVDTMRAARGVGLAAPQVHESLRLFVMEPDGEGSLHVVANPVLSFPSDDTQELWEGCLSIPGIRGLTCRRAEVHVEGLDRHGAPQTLFLRGLAAAVGQHETDHLDGIFFFRRMPDLSRIGFEDELARHREDEGEDREGEAEEG